MACSPRGLHAIFIALLLHVVVRLVIKDHAFAQHLDGLEFFEHDRLTALRADTAGHMVKLFAVGHRSARRL